MDTDDRYSLTDGMTRWSGWRMLVSWNLMTQFNNYSGFPGKRDSHMDHGCGHQITKLKS
jgi:hypothetical protein